MGERVKTDYHWRDQTRPALRATTTIGNRKLDPVRIPGEMRLSCDLAMAGESSMTRTWVAMKLSSCLTRKERITEFPWSRRTGKLSIARSYRLQ